MAADPRRNEVAKGEAWKQQEARRRPRRTGDTSYDRGAARGEAFGAVLARWRLEQGANALSQEDFAYELSMRVGRTVHRNEVRRTHDGESRPLHLTPRMVAAYISVYERTDVDSVAEAYSAIRLLPPEVEQEDLKLAIASARARHSRGSQVA